MRTNRWIFTLLLGLSQLLFLCSVRGQGSLPSGWTDGDIGSVGTAGSASYATNVFTVNGSGTFGSGETVDAFHFVYQPLSGDGTIVARLRTAPGAGYAGVMIRETLNANATNIFMGYYGWTNYLTVGYRLSTGASSSTVVGATTVTLPQWVKAVRSGSTFSAYTSLDGVNWTQMGSSETISMAQSVYIGVFASSNRSTLGTGTLDNVSVNSTSSPAPAITEVSATTGPIGSQIVITGTGFGVTQGSSVVLLNALSTTVNSWSATSITITIPSGATSGDLVVSVAPSMNDSNPVEFDVTSQPLPSGWLDEDVGSVGVVGSATFSSGTFTVKGAGTITGGGGGYVPNDSLHFAYQMITGDVTIVARIVSMPTSGLAGVMLRNTLDTGSADAFVTYWNSGNPTNYIYFGERLAEGTNDNMQTPCCSPVALPYWVKLVRSGSAFNGYMSPDGVTWTLAGPSTAISMGQNIYVGLFMLSGSSSTLGTATFDNVSINTASTPAPQITSVSTTSGAVGSQVVISGNGFGTTQGSSVVVLNGAPVTISSWSATSITITIPSGATSGYLVVSVAPSMNDSNPVTFTVTSQPLPSGWLDQDIGSTGKTGSASYANSTFTIQGAGNGITGTADAFHFVYQPLTSNGTIIARVTGNSSYYGPAGVMVRETLDAFSSEIFTFATESGPSYTNLNARTIPSGGTTTASGSAVTLPYWLEIIRNANTFTAYGSTNGTTWTQIGTAQMITTADTVYVGLGVSSGSTATLATATFDNVSISLGSALPTPIVTGITPTSGAPGASVTINGSGFGMTQGTGTVAFNGGSASVTSWSDSQITALVPSNASSGPVSVQSGGITAQGPSFTVTFGAQVTDSLGNQSTYNAQPFGGLWLMTSSSGSGCSSCSYRGTLQNQYDSFGNALWTIDALGNITVNKYDSSSDLLSQTLPVNSTTTATTSSTYNSFGEVLSVTDALGNVTRNVYDSHGNLTSVTTPPPNSNTAGSVTSFTYNSLGELTQITDPLNNVTTLTYTSAGLIATITDAQNNVTTYGYDAHGNRTSITDALNHQTTFAYDAGDRLTTITYPDTTTTTFAYDSRGRRTSATDQNGKTTSYAYDNADRLTSVTDAATNVTAYGYDTENNLISITDANSHETTFSYDAFGRVTQTNFPSSQIETYAYDANNNLTSKTDRKGQTIGYIYDSLNRLIQKNYPDSSNVEYVYDLVGKIKSVTDPTGTYALAYDNMGRLIGTTTSYSFLTARNFTTAYAYDKASNRTGFTDPENGSTNYAYDTLNRLTTLTPPSAFTTGSFGFSYDALNRRTQMTRPNSVTTNYSYDNLSHMLSVLHQLSGSTIDGASYTVDNTGNRTAKTDQQAHVTSSYTYDAIYQLLSATQGGSTTESYTYDSGGNRTTSLGVSSYSNNVSNELTSTSSNSYTYDANGNRLTGTTGSNTTTYTWDYENRLTSVTLPGTGGTVTFKYDPFGRRIYKSSSSGTSIYTYDGDNLIEETNAAGAAIARYSQGLNIDEPLAMLRSSTTSFYNADGLGSVTSLSNSAGALVQTYGYDSFGKQTGSSGSLTNPFQYTARESDTETGLYYYRARYYDANVGRFLNEDPGGSAGNDVNFYRYANNNAANWVDPFGLTAAPAIPWPWALPGPTVWPWAGPIGVAIGLTIGDLAFPNATSSDDVLRKDPLDCDKKDRCKKQLAADNLWCEFMFANDPALEMACLDIAITNAERCLAGLPRIDPDPRNEPAPIKPNDPKKPEPPLPFPKPRKPRP
jgi:RHS repeat-associated protein